jgi:hypothetical protein
MPCGADAINAQKIGGRNRELVDENGCTTPHMSLEWAAKMVVTEREARGYDPERTHLVDRISCAVKPSGISVRSICD